MEVVSQFGRRIIDDNRKEDGMTQVQQAPARSERPQSPQTKDKELAMLVAPALQPGPPPTRGAPEMYTPEDVRSELSAKGSLALIVKTGRGYSYIPVNVRTKTGSGFIVEATKRRPTAEQLTKEAARLGVEEIHAAKLAGTFIAIVPNKESANIRVATTEHAMYGVLKLR